MTTHPSLTIIVPCYNEGARIEASLRSLTEWFGGAAEIIVADDGSRDDSAERAERFAQAHPQVRVARMPANRGKGAAVRAAAVIARGERIVLVDADLSYDYPSLARAVDGLDRADFVAGNRRHPDSTYEVPVRLFGFLYRRHLVGLTFNLLVRALLRLDVRDTQCGLKAFRRDALLRMVPSLSTDGFAQDVEMLLVARALGLRYATVPVTVTYESAASSVRLARSAAVMGGSILRLAGRQAAGRYSAARVAAAAATSGPRSEAPRQEAQGP